MTPANTNTPFDEAVAHVEREIWKAVITAAAFLLPSTLLLGFALGVVWQSHF